MQESSDEGIQPVERELRGVSAGDLEGCLAWAERRLYDPYARAVARRIEAERVRRIRREYLGNGRRKDGRVETDSRRRRRAALLEVRARDYDDLWVVDWAVLDATLELPLRASNEEIAARATEILIQADELYPGRFYASAADFRTRAVEGLDSAETDDMLWFLDLPEGSVRLDEADQWLEEITRRFERSRLEPSAMPGRPLGKRKPVTPEVVSRRLIVLEAAGASRRGAEPKELTTTGSSTDCNTPGWRLVLDEMTLAEARGASPIAACIRLSRGANRCTGCDAPLPVQADGFSVGWPTKMNYCPDRFDGRTCRR